MRPKSIPPLLDGIVLVLDRPRDVTNVGGVVRAMGNFGLSRLRLVEPAAYDEERILAVAHRSTAILQRLERHPSLDSALADCGFVLGATARPRAVRHERLSPRQAAPALLRAAEMGLRTEGIAGTDDTGSATGVSIGVAGDQEDGAGTGSPHGSAAPAAVLFGPEDRGLDNAALGRCNAVITIPTTPTYASLNLAQAVLLIGYELWLDATESATTPRVPDAVAALGAGARDAALHEPLARGAAREEMFAALEEVLWGMHPNNDAGRVGHALARLRAVLSRAAPRSEEVAMLTRLFIHIARQRSDE